MEVLVWMTITFGKQGPSVHLLTAIIEVLCKKGYTVHIIQKGINGDMPLIPDCLKNYDITMDCVSVKEAPKSNFFGRYWVELAYFFNSLKYVKKYKNSRFVFNQSSIVSGMMAIASKMLLKKAKLTINVQDIFPDNALFAGSVNPFICKLMSIEPKIAYKKADSIITISEDMKDLLVQKGVDAKKIDVIYNWSYQDEPYKYDEIKNNTIASMLTDEFFNVVYAGNIGVMQNVDVVVEAARKMNDAGVMFHIFGNGIYKDKLQKQAEGLNNIKFWDMQPSKLAPSIYGMADVNIIPLAKNIHKTALPSKTATCLACQKPIIFCFDKSSKFGNWMNKEAGCYVIDCDDAEALCNTIKEIKKSDAVIDRSELFKENFSKSKNSARYADIITDKV